MFGGIVCLRASRQNGCLDFAEELLVEAKQFINAGSDIIPKDTVEIECRRIKDKILHPPSASSLKIDDADYFNDTDR